MAKSVVAYYNEEYDTLVDSIKQVVDRLPLFTRHRVIIYVKNAEHSVEAVNVLTSIGDEVVWLPNIGREGETYLVSFPDGSPQLDFRKILNLNQY